MWRALSIGRASRKCLVFGLFVVVACSASSTLSTANSDGGASDADVASKGGGASLDASSLAEASAPRCDVAKPFGTPVLVTELDQGNDQSLRLSSDYLTAFFASARGSDAGITALYSATRNTPQGAFSNVTALSTLDLPQGCANPSLTGDGLTLYFNGVVGTSSNVDLYSVTRASSADEFIAPVQIAAVNTPGVEDAPFIREDGKVLYFASDNDNPSGLFRLYASNLSNSGFSPAVAIDELNTSAGNEDAPVITPDGLVMYFGSERTGGGALGSYDVWVATRTTTNDPFGTPRNVSEVNGPTADKPTFITRDRCTLYEQRTDGVGPTTARSIYVAAKSP